MFSIFWKITLRLLYHFTVYWWEKKIAPKNRQFVFLPSSWFHITVCSYLYLYIKFNHWIFESGRVWSISSYGQQVSPQSNLHLSKRTLWEQLININTIHARNSYCVVITLLKFACSRQNNIIIINRICPKSFNSMG